MILRMAIIVAFLSGCAHQPPAEVYTPIPGYLPAYPQYEAPQSAAPNTVVLGQGGIAVCH